MTRFLRCRCLTEEVEEDEGPSLGSTSEERDLTRLRKGLSLVGKLRDFEGDELELFWLSVRDGIGEVGLELVRSPGDSGLTALSVDSSWEASSNISSLASKPVTTLASS